MKLTLLECSSLNVNSRHEPLTELERLAADYIADHIHGKELGISVGKFICRVCRQYGVDHQRAARLLGMRSKRR